MSKEDLDAGLVLGTVTSAVAGASIGYMCRYDPAMAALATLAAVTMWWATLVLGVVLIGLRKS